jgi:hypothetical protein
MKPILVVTSQYAKEIKNRIDRDFEARRNPHSAPFSRDELLTTAHGRRFIHHAL